MLFNLGMETGLGIKKILNPNLLNSSKNWQCVTSCSCWVGLVEPITRIISKQLDIKLGPFTQEELDSVLRKIKNRKAAGLDEIPPEVWKTKQFDDILLRHCNAVYNQNPIDRWTKGCILPFPKKGDLGLAKNYWGITLTSIAAKIYNALLRNRIEPKIDNILRKNQNGLGKEPTSDINICRLYQGFRLHSQGKDGTNPTSVRHT